MESKIIQHKVFLVRHGQCRGNVTGETLPHEEDVITDLGRKQAAALGDHLKDVEFKRAFSSNYQRAIETAKEFLNRLENPIPPLIEDERIKERDFGNLVELGVTSKDIIRMTMEKLAEGHKFNEIEIPGGESIREYEERQRSFLKDLLESLRDSKSSENILMVSHGLTMRRFLVGFNDGIFSQLCLTENWSNRCASVVENTSCTTFTIQFQPGEDKPVVTFEKVHCTEHLNKLKMEMGQGDNNEGHENSSHDVSSEEKKKFIEQMLKIPGAKEELSGCVQV